MKQRKQVLGALGALALGAAALMGCPGPQYPNCRGDQDCREHHEVCVNSHCQQCRTSAECADGGTCLRNRCLAGPDGCESDSDCTGGRRCVANHCVVPQCDDTHPCPGGAPCTNHQCPPADGGTDTDPTDNHGRLCTFTPVLFGFDSYVLDDAARRNLQTASECLQREGVTRYVLIGRTDNVGSGEYNLALGERRAGAVQRYLGSLGVELRRIYVSSEGAEAASGTDEAARTRDRRVDFRPRD